MSKTLLKISLAACFALTSIKANAQDVLPKPVSASYPGYPTALTDTGISGGAVVNLTVKTDGSVEGAELAVTSENAFGEAALSAVKTWRFEPGTHDGKPVEMKVSIPLIFKAPIDQQVNAAAKRKAFVTLSDPVLSQGDYGMKLKLTKASKPVFPTIIAGKNLNQDLREIVEVNFVVAPDGTTVNPVVLGSPPKEFVIPAMVAVAQMKYSPPSRSGKGVYVEASAKLHFTLKRRDTFQGAGEGSIGAGLGAMDSGMGARSGLGGGVDGIGGMGIPRPQP